MGGRKKMTISAGGNSAREDDVRSPSNADTRRHVYFNEFNVLMEGSVYLPLASGLLRASAELLPRIIQQYQFMPFSFIRQTPEAILAEYSTPSVVAFSVSMWNEQLSLKVAELTKLRFPGCLIVFGGPQVPHIADDYFARYPFLDVAVRGEGERVFCEILTRFVETRDFEGIANITWRNPGTGNPVRGQDVFPDGNDLDVYPSPYLSGVFNYLFAPGRNMEFQTIVETNRGCPFSCAYCFWGRGGFNRKWRFHSIERVAAELEWCGEHRIRYVMNADSNFGMHNRDHEIAELLVETKRKYGFPEKFRSCYGKNSDERIFRIGKLLHEHKMEKGITLSHQTMDSMVLKNIGRKNIKLSDYERLQQLFSAHHVPVYTELILGLPGETYLGWVEGVERLLQAGLKNQLFIYHCQVYPNTTLADEEYRRRFGIQTRRLRLTEIHGAIRGDTSLSEFEEVVVATSSMPQADWQRAAVFSWVTMALVSLKVAFFVLQYLAQRFGIKYGDVLRFLCEDEVCLCKSPIWSRELEEFTGQTARLLSGASRGREMPGFGALYWDEEEACFLRLSKDWDSFYSELTGMIEIFLTGRSVAFDREELGEVMVYQSLSMPRWNATYSASTDFRFNLPEYFHAIAHGASIALKAKPQVATVESTRRYDGDSARFAREVLLWGRKSDTILESVTWRDTDGS